MHESEEGFDRADFRAEFSPSPNLEGPQPQPRDNVSRNFPTASSSPPRARTNNDDVGRTRYLADVDLYCSGWCSFYYFRKRGPCHWCAVGIANSSGGWRGDFKQKRSSAPGLTNTVCYYCVVHQCPRSSWNDNRCSGRKWKESSRETKKDVHEILDLLVDNQQRDSV
ncbi:hypothetical protein WN55_02183 [Dufourea novaeangliae]|uniref:Uncharacterized protein n=1 Tax=Dufourea novaeangliae TaxID=178035 RepID=A0A154NYZ4_DUFNO|nr:hypothetical protein WN55_02183 [Dufourea novaeangliae]